MSGKKVEMMTHELVATLSASAHPMDPNTSAISVEFAEEAARILGSDFDDWHGWSLTDKVMHYLFANFPPASGELRRVSLAEIADHARRLQEQRAQEEEVRRIPENLLSFVNILRQLEVLADGDYPETDHLRADNLLLIVIRKLAETHPEGATLRAIERAFDAIPKWYA